MPSNLLPVTIDFGTIPLTGQGYTPQEFANRLGTNGRIFTEQAFALFTTGATAPTSDTGPWAKDGNTWYYWDSGTGSYVPFLVPPQSLKYYVGAITPDPLVYLFWIKLDGLGSPLGLFTYYAGNWVDVYSSSGYMTVAAFNTAIAAYSTTAQMNTADAATLAAAEAYTNTAIGSLPSTSLHPGASSASGQTESADNTPHAVAGFSYVAPVTGSYFVSAELQVDNAGANASDMTVSLTPSVNGSDAGLGSSDNGFTPAGDRWFPKVAELISANAGDTIACNFAADSTVGNVTVSQGKMSVFFVPA